jgi:hypothetical protein
MYLTRSLTVEVDMEETLDRTDARASVTLRGRTFTGYGHARRNPMDENLPEIGEELAAARAMIALAAQLMTAAEITIEERERLLTLANA